MTTASLSPLLKAKYFDNNGAPLANGKLFTFSAGTSTPIATFVDSTGTTTNTNPIILNQRGECDCWVLSNTAYKFVLQDSLGNLIWTEDNVINNSLLNLYGGLDTGAANAYILTFLSPFATYAAFTGTPIFWVPSNSNTGPSTMNVNGLGVVPIVNPDGTALGPNQIRSGIIQEIVFFNGSFQLLSLSSFTGSTVGTFGTESPIASAATTDLGLALAHTVLVTGTTTITSFGSAASTLAPIYILRFQASLTLTYNAATLILPGNASIVTMGGDAAIAEYLGGGAWKVMFYQSSGGQQNSKIKPADTVLVSTTTLTPDPDLQTNTLAVGRYSYELYLEFDSVASGAGFKFQNDGSLVDQRANSIAVVYGSVNSAAYGPKIESFYSAPISFATVANTANGNQALYKGSLLVNTPGTFGVSWAQNASTASNTTLRAGSYLVTTLLNTGASSGSTTHVYTTPGSFTETIPAGFTNVTVEVWGASGGGGNSFIVPSNDCGGGGGGSGGYSRTTQSVVGLAGQNINFTVGAAGAGGGGGTGVTSAVSSGTYTIATMTANGGAFGNNATGTNVPGTGGLGGTSTGGNVINTAGNTGNTGFGNVQGGQGGLGGIGISGVAGGGSRGGQGGGGPGGVLTQPGLPGGVGVVIFQYS